MLSTCVVLLFSGAVLMRRVYSETRFGPIFWLARNDSVPMSNITYPLYTDMDAETKTDASMYLATLVNESVRLPATNGETTKVKFNERSLYALPNSNGTKLVLLLRTGKNLWSAECNDDKHQQFEKQQFQQKNSKLGFESDSKLTFSCRSGTGSFMYEVPSLQTINDVNISSEPINCNWSIPVQTNIPDAPSRTCAGHLPNARGIGGVGRQGSSVCEY